MKYLMHIILLLSYLFLIGAANVGKSKEALNTNIISSEMMKNSLLSSTEGDVVAGLTNCGDKVSPQAKQCSNACKIKGK